MISDSAAVVMLAIRSAIRLGQQLNRAYIESTQRRELVLPLPNFFSKPTLATALDFFAGDGKTHLEGLKQLRTLRAKQKKTATDAAQIQRLALREHALERLEELIKLHQDTGGLTSGETAEVLAFYDEYFYAQNLERDSLPSKPGSKEDAYLNAAEFNALLTVRQWKRGSDPNPSVLQRMVGSFIEIGVDYFQTVPGALNRNSAQGKLLGAFLDGMSEIPFAEGKLGELPQKLFVAAIETIAEQGDSLTRNERGQALIKGTAKAVSENVANRIEKLRAEGKSDLLQEQRIGDWAELIFRSVVSGAGRLAVEDPQRFLGLKDPARASLVTQVGDTMLDLILDQPDGELDGVFTRSSLDQVLKTALQVVGEHPEILTGAKEGALPVLLSEIATELSGFDSLITADLLPDLTRLILEKTTENLDLIWPDFAKKPQNHLLLTAVKATVGILVKPVPDGSKWAVQFTRADLLSVTNTVLAELVANPGWLAAGAAKIDANLSAALEATLGVLRNQADERLSPALGIAVLRAAFLSVALRQEFLRKVKAGAPGAGQPFIAAVLDIILAAVFNDDVAEEAAWQLLRANALESIVQISVEQLAKTGLGPKELESLVKIVKEHVVDLEQGNLLDLVDFTGDLAKELGVPLPT